MCPPANHGEAVGRGEIARGRYLGHRLLAGVDEVWVFFALVREWPEAEHPVLALQLHSHPRRDVVRNQRRDADAQIDVEAVAQFLGGALGHLLAVQAIRLPPGSCRRHGALAHRALLDVFHRLGHVHQALDVHAWRYDVVGIDIAGLHEVLDFGHGHLAGSGHHRIEVTRGLAIDEVTLGIAHPGVHDGEVGDEPALHHIAGAVEFALLLALRDLRTGAGSREECGNAGAAGADALGQSTLRIELDLELAREVLLRESLVLAHIGRDHFLDLLGVEQKAKSDAVDAAIVGHHGQVFHARVADRLDQLSGMPQSPKPPAMISIPSFNRPASAAGASG